MSNKLVDHSWRKIAERGAQAKSEIRSKLALIADLTQWYRSLYGEEASRQISDDGCLEYALRKCLEHLEGDSDISKMDYFIYCNYATYAARQVDRVLLEYAAGSSVH